MVGADLVAPSSLLGDALAGEKGSRRVQGETPGERAETLSPSVAGCESRGRSTVCELRQVARSSGEGAMGCFGGRKVSTEWVQMGNLAGAQCIEEIMNRCNYVLIPDLPREVMAQGIRSAIIAPVLIDGKCRGVLYAENSTDHEHYVAADLDYLMLIAIHAAAVLDNL